MAEFIHRLTRNHLREQTDAAFHRRMQRARIDIGNSLLDVGEDALSVRRLIQGMSQLQLAEALGVDGEQMYDIENKKVEVPSSLVSKYAVMIGVSEDFVKTHSKEKTCN